MAIREIYGIEWSAEHNDLAIELACYRDPITFVTGLKREQHMRAAFQILWPKFKWNEWLDLMCWAWCNFKVASIMGHTRAGKTYGAAHFVLLDYLAAPSLTATTLVTTKFDALKTRLWGDLMRATESCAQKPAIDALFKITSSSNEMKFAQRGTPADAKYIIQGVALDQGDTSASKVRGQHTDRRRIIGDEAQDISAGLYSAFTNAMSAPDFIGWLLTNPVERISEYGDWSKPRGGWGSVNDMDLFWLTERGVCLHLDGLQSPNIKAGRTIFPQMMTHEYVESMRPYEGTLEWWMYVRGFFPPDGFVARLWPNAAIMAAEKTVDFDFIATPCASLDPAFTYDDCALVLALQGRLRNQKPCMMAKKSFKIQWDVSSKTPAEYLIAREVMRICVEFGVQPENFIMDETGNGRGVLAVLRMEWSPKVQGISYGGESTNRPIRMDDIKPANEQVKYFVTELWYRASMLAQQGLLCGLDNVDKKTKEDLNSRRYTVRQFGENKLMVAESKDEMKKRLDRSPDFGDAFCQLGELMVRKGLIGDLPGTGVKNTWREGKNRAIKTSKRFAEQGEYAHG